MNTFATLIGGVGKHVHSSAGMRSRALWLARSKEPRGGGESWPQASHLLLWLVRQLVKASRSHAQVTH